MSTSMENFALLDDPLLKRAYLGKVSGEPPWRLTIEYALAESSPESPLEVTHRRGRRHPSDIIWPYVRAMIVSDRAANVLHGFSGWSPYDVKVFDGYGELVTGFVGLGVSGR